MSDPSFDSIDLLQKSLLQPLFVPDDLTNLFDKYTNWRDTIKDFSNILTDQYIINDMRPIFPNLSKFTKPNTIAIESASKTPSDNDPTDRNTIQDNIAPVSVTIAIEIPNTDAIASFLYRGARTTHDRAYIESTCNNFCLTALGLRALMLVSLFSESTTSKIRFKSISERRTSIRQSRGIRTKTPTEHINV